MIMVVVFKMGDGEGEAVETDVYWACWKSCCLGSWGENRGLAQPLPARFEGDSSHTSYPISGQAYALI